MGLPMKPVRTWILIANGARARVLLLEGVGKGLKALPSMVFGQKPKKASDIMADRPGRTFDSSGAGRHSMAYPSEPERGRERAFAAMLTGALKEAYEEGEFERLVLVAPPQALGDLRETLSLDLTRILRGTLAKDLTRLPNDDVPKHLEDLLAV